MKPITILIIKYSIAVFLALLFAWWIFDQSSFNIPEYIPNTPLRIHGLFLGVAIITILISALKRALRITPDLNIAQLMLVGSIIAFTAEGEFQSILSETFSSDKLYHFFHNLIGTTIFMIIVSFFISFQLKTKRTGLLILLIVAFSMFFQGLVKVFPTLTTP